MFFITIIGGSASGKTTFAQRLSSMLPNSFLLSQDHYYHDVSHLSNTQINEYNFDHPDAIMSDELINNLIQLSESGEVKIPFYDFCSNTNTLQHTLVSQPRIVILEGLFPLHFPEIRGVSNLNIFIEADSETRLSRRIQRDVHERGCSHDEVVERFNTFVEPCFQTYIQPQHQFCHQIVNSENFDHSINSIRDTAILLSR